MAPGSTPRPYAPRPLADAPVAGLLPLAQALAKGWLLALLDAVPLEAAAELPAAELARDGPRLCAAVVRALGSEDELDRLRPGGDLAATAAATGELAGARRPSTAAAAVEALRAVIFSAALAQLPDAGPQQIAALAERLAHVAAIVRDATLVDGAQSRRLSEPPSKAPAASLQPLGPGDPAWLGELHQRIAAAELDGQPLALLLVELEDADRIAASEAGPEAAAALGEATRAIRSELRRVDVLAAEGGGRLWVIATSVGRAGALALAARVAMAVERASSVRGAPLVASVGFAVHGEDGRDAAALIERAEEAVFQARADGRRVASDEPPNGPRPGPRLVG